MAKTYQEKELANEETSVAAVIYSCKGTNLSKHRMRPSLFINLGNFSPRKICKRVFTSTVCNLAFENDGLAYVRILCLNLYMIIVFVHKVCMLVISFVRPLLDCECGVDIDASNQV